MWGFKGTRRAVPRKQGEATPSQIEMVVRKALGMITQEQLDNWFVYHAPKDGQPEAYAELRAAGKAFADAIVRLTPASADQSAAIRKVREAVYTANAAIACEGK